jgi:DNA primase
MGARVDRQLGLHRITLASCTLEDLDHPDELRVDLDPGVSWVDVRNVALEMRSLLEEMELRGWPKTSGSRGMHLNVRIHPPGPSPK